MLVLVAMMGNDTDRAKARLSQRLQCKLKGGCQVEKERPSPTTTRSQIWLFSGDALCHRCLCPECRISIGRGLW